MNTPADYIRAYMPERPVDTSRAALVMIDMQYATCSRQGALARKLQADRSSQTACPKPAIQASALAISDVSKG